MMRLFGMRARPGAFEVAALMVPKAGGAVCRLADTMRVGVPAATGDGAAKLRRSDFDRSERARSSQPWRRSGALPDRSRCRLGQPLPDLAQFMFTLH